MQDLKLKTVLTTDRHFLQIGFQVLPGFAAKPR
jgi:predicted nucleic acid-binding protein